MTSKRACIFGATGGIGRALTRMLADAADYERIYACARTNRRWKQAKIVPLRFDLTSEPSIADVARRIANEGPLDLVIVATGVLHRKGALAPEKSWRALDPLVMAEMFALNSTGPALIAKHMLPVMKKGERTVFAALSARVGSTQDNHLGGWHSYRASKAALNMLVRNFAWESCTRNPQGVVVALHPGTVDTGLSAPFQPNIAARQLQSPSQSAANLINVISTLTPEQSGGFYAWNGESIAF